MGETTEYSEYTEMGENRCVSCGSINWLMFPFRVWRVFRGLGPPWFGLSDYKAFVFHAGVVTEIDQ